MDGDADVRRDRYLPPRKPYGAGHCLLELAGDEGRVVGGGWVRNQYHELVAVAARHGVFGPDAAGQAFGDHLEQAVPLVVADGVVHRLEVVQIQHEKRHLAPLPAGHEQRLAHAVGEQVAVHEPGQEVVARLVFELLLVALALGDVLEGLDHRQQLPAAGTYRCGVEYDVAVLPVQVGVPPLRLEPFRDEMGLPHRAVLLAHPFEVAGDHEVGENRGRGGVEGLPGEVGPDHLLRLPAGQLLAGAVPDQHAVLGIQHEDGDGALLQ